MFMDTFYVIFVSIKMKMRIFAAEKQVIMQDIIGRKKERKELERLYESGRPEFVAVYGRRRVGKTFLVREHFSGRFTFYHTAISPADYKGKMAQLQREQLRAFCTSIQQFGGDWDDCPKTGSRHLPVSAHCLNSEAEQAANWSSSTNCHGWTPAARGLCRRSNISGTAGAQGSLT